MPTRRIIKGITKQQHPKDRRRPYRFDAAYLQAVARAVRPEAPKTDDYDGWKLIIQRWLVCDSDYRVDELSIRIVYELIRQLIAEDDQYAWVDDELRRWS